MSNCRSVGADLLRASISRMGPVVIVGDLSVLVFAERNSSWSIKLRKLEK
jgi:nitrogen fixation/metabolism regulation signal transduction histidine kinase